MPFGCKGHYMLGRTGSTGHTRILSDPDGRVSCSSPMSDNVLTLRRGAPRRTCSVRTRRDDAGRSCRDQIHVSSARRAAPYAERADQARHVRRPANAGRSILHPAARAAQAAGLKLFVGSSGFSVGRDDGAMSDHDRRPTGPGVNPPTAASTRRAWRFVVVILAGSAKHEPRPFAAGGSGSYTHTIRQAALIAPTIGGFSSLRSSESGWSDTVEPPALLRP
jgi:hypothetical protein